MSSSSAEVEEELSVVQPNDSNVEFSKKPMRSYTRDFLLSLCELEVCRKLPEDFDASLLSEFEGPSDSFQDRRTLGSSSVPGYKRTEYGSTGSGRGDSGNYSRGLNRWDSRSSGRSDTDTDSESGRRIGTQPRRSWQSSEHDGLLGSGSFPRPSGFAAGAPVPRFRPNDNVHLNRSNEPYHPPRPYKAGPHSRRETNDSFNDETFGSADSASEDRVEEEKKRRAEFELMRKEQHKALQEKQKSNQGKTEDPFSDIGSMDIPNDDKSSSGLNKISKQGPQDEPTKVSVPSQTPPSRPLVPPGFVSSVVDKSSPAKSLAHPEPLEMGKLELDSQPHMIPKAQGRGFSSLQSHTSVGSDIKADKIPDLPSVIQSVDHTKAPILPDVSGVLDNGAIIGLDFEVSGPKLLGGPAHSTSILDKLFGNALTTGNDSKSNVVEDDSKTEDIWSTSSIESKFSRWFPEEERKAQGNTSSENPNTLLSLISGGEKGGSNVSEISSIKSIFNSEKVLEHKISKLPSSITSEKVSNSYIPESKPSVMTCEDLEQSMLSEISGVKSNSMPQENEHHILEVEVGNREISVDNQASKHLLSLLKKESGSKDSSFASVFQERTPEKSINQDIGELGVHDSDGVNSSAKTLTLETLFGSAFMKELHSAQKNTLDSERIDASNGNENGNNLSNDGISTFDKVGDWLGFNDAFQTMELSKHASEIDSKFNGINLGNQSTLPEEDSLINLIDPINAENPNRSNSNIPIDVLEKLVTLGGTHNPHLFRGPSDVPNPEIQFQNIHPQTQASNMNHNRPVFHALDSHPTHMDPHLNFMPPNYRDVPAQHQFSPNMGHPSFPYPSGGQLGFDGPMPPLLQQMHMAGNIPPPHLGRGFSSGGPMASHPGQNPANYIQEPNMIQNFPFDQRQSYFGGPGIGPTGPELGVANNPPEAFQRLMEMELRANPKQMHPHPFAGSGPSRPMYGHELDMGFRYR